MTSDGMTLGEMAPPRRSDKPGRRELGWYRPLVHNRTVAGSLFTLLGLPFMLAFVSMVVVGAFALRSIDGIVLTMAAGAVAIMLYGEHLLDDTVRAGKPWDTVLSDRTLFSLAVVCFSLATIIAIVASLYLASPVPLIGTTIGIAFTILYGLEIWKFHTVWFGGLGMGSVAPFSYLAQSIALHRSFSVAIAVLLLIAGIAYGYVMLSLYEHTKTDGHAGAWNLLGVQLIMLYALAGATMIGAVS